MRKYEELVSGWEEVLEDILSGVDIEELKHLIFESYHFWKNEIKDGTVQRNRLELFRLIGQFYGSVSANYPSGMSASVADTCAAFAYGLCHAVEKGFDCGYGKNALLIESDTHTPAGCSEPEADMTTYETFERDFNDEVEFRREEYMEEPEDEFEDV